MSKSAWRRNDLIYINKKKNIVRNVIDNDETIMLYRPYVFGNASYASGVDMLIACDNFDSASWYGMSTLDGHPLKGKKTFPNPADDYAEIFVLRFSLNPSASSQYVNSVKSKLTNLYFMGYNNFDSAVYLRNILYIYFIDNTNHIAYKLEPSLQHSTSFVRFQTDTASMSYSGYSKSVGRITVTHSNNALDDIDTALQAEGLSFGYMYMSNVQISDAQLTNELGCTTIQTLTY